MTNLFGKNLEKLVHKHLLGYFIDHGIISDRQYGFLPGKSTHEAIFDLVKHVYSSINNKKLMGMLFLDISKAFDCIIHERLFLKLAAIGCNDILLTWFRSYLRHTQILLYNNVESSSLNVATGIGQGTILGPLIFIFYMNDVVDKLYYVKLSMYADDCVLYLSANNWPRLRIKLQEDLDRFEHWGELNNLHLNVKKSKFMIVSNRSKLSPLDDIEPLHLYNHDVNRVTQYNYLGVILDAEMSLRPFFNHVRKLVHAKLFSFRKIRKYLAEESAIMVYKHTILPYLEYAGFMLVACNIEDRRDLQKCQNDALRICTHVNLNDHYRIQDLHVRCKIISLEPRRRIQLLLLMYKKSKDISMLKVFPRNTRRSTRIVFRTDNYEGTLYKRGPYFQGCKFWDNLPLDVVELPDIFSFKIKLKRLNSVYVDLLG